jgi:hypothetical protein
MPKPERFRMKAALKPDASVLEGWRLLCLQAKVLEAAIARAREEMIQAQDSRTRIAVLAQAQMAQRRVLRALTSLVP